MRCAVRLFNRWKELNQTSAIKFMRITSLKKVTRCREWVAQEIPERLSRDLVLVDNREKGGT